MYKIIFTFFFSFMLIACSASTPNITPSSVLIPNQSDNARIYIYMSNETNISQRLFSCDIKHNGKTIGTLSRNTHIVYEVYSENITLNVSRLGSKSGIKMRIAKGNNYFLRIKADGAFLIPLPFLISFRPARFNLELVPKEIALNELSNSISKQDIIREDMISDKDMINSDKKLELPESSTYDKIETIHNKNILNSISSSNSDTSANTIESQANTINNATEEIDIFKLSPKKK